MTIKRLSSGKTARYRRFNDRLTRGIVSGGGLLVLLALVVMFLYLLYAVMPLFRSPALVALGSTPQPAISVMPLNRPPMELTENGAFLLTTAGRAR